MAEPAGRLPDEAHDTEGRPKLRQARVRPGARRRRLRRTVGALAAVAVVASLFGWWRLRVERPPTRRPGEALPDITDRLAQRRPGEAPPGAFTDVTAAAGLDGFVTFRGTRTSQLPEDMGGGAAWGDYDDDGDDDLFLVAAGGSLADPPEGWAASELFENRGDGTLRRVPGFPDLRILGMAAAWGDADGDGDLDLAVSGYRTLRLYRNEGGGRFTRDEGFPDPQGYWAGLAWGDFDRDGDLDLYVCGYVEYRADAIGAREASQQYGAAVPYTLNPASFEPLPNLLLENDGAGRFTDTAALWGVSDPGGRSLSALWHDFDDDGRLDLYVANDISDNALFLNRGDTFEDAGLAAWVADYRGAMGLAAGDWNRDGDDDLFVTHWVAQENALYDSQLRHAPPGPEEPLLRPAEAGAASPRLTFTDVSSPLGLGAPALPVVGWGTELADFDADGWLDVAVANGSTLEMREDPTRLEPQASALFWNGGGRGFHAVPIPALAPRVSRGLAAADLEGDGDLDLLIVHLDGGVQLLRNDLPQGHWLELDLRHRLPSGAWGRGEGATVVAWVGGVPLRRSVTGASYLSQSTRTLHFGLGEAAAVDRLEVRWPGGEVRAYDGVPGNGRWELREGDEAARRVGPAAAVSAPALSREETVEFWRRHRAGMDAMKRDGDIAAAVAHFRSALELDPTHEDARYYLANGLWALGEGEAALAELDTLRAMNPGSHRAHRRWATLRALTAHGDAELDAAAAAAARALEINREETGALLLLGEIELLRGRPDEAERRLEAACRTNPRAVEGFFLRGYLAWAAGSRDAAIARLREAAAARGPEWKPEGSVAEGDVAQRMHRDESPLGTYWQSWSGTLEPAEAFGPLAARLGSGPA